MRRWRVRKIDLANIPLILLPVHTDSGADDVGDRSRAASLSPFGSLVTSLLDSRGPEAGCGEDREVDDPRTLSLRMMGFERDIDLYLEYKANRISKLARMQRTLLSLMRAERYISGPVHEMLQDKLNARHWPFTATQVINQTHQIPLRSVPQMLAYCAHGMAN